MANSVFCTVENSREAAQVVHDLEAAGFPHTDISVLMVDQSGLRDSTFDDLSEVPEAAASVAGAGAILGGGLGWLAGIGALTIPGVGPLLAVGPIVGAISGVAVGGTVGGLTGALVGLGISESHAKHYDGKLQGGHILISVRCEDATERMRAKALFEAAGAEDISTSDGSQKPR